MSEDPHQPEPIDQNEVTRLLHEIQQRPERFDRIIPLVYDDLKRIGHQQRRQLPVGITMQTTALVHEAFIKLRGHANNDIENRLHLQRLAALVMRQLTLDYARKRSSAKRGSGQRPVELEDQRVESREPDAEQVLAIEQVIQRMEQASPRMAEIASARFFAGYQVDEIADMLNVSTRTVTRDLTRARAWLKTELADASAE
ncbi:MAG: ECF-type sigma factor [Pseudomonadota bacterium]